MDFWLGVAMVAIVTHLVTDVRLALVAVKREHRRDLLWTSVTIVALLVHVWMDWS